VVTGVLVDESAEEGADEAISDAGDATEVGSDEIQVAGLYHVVLYRAEDIDADIMVAWAS
jgi:hypothetical protein